MNLDAALLTYISESRELLEEMEDLLLALEQQPQDSTESLNAIFRAAHTIKGSAGLFGLEHIMAFTHELESLLDACRNGLLPLQAELITTLLACKDHIGKLIDLTEQKQDVDQALLDMGLALSKQLQQWQPTPGKHLALVTDDEQQEIKIERLEGEQASSDNWHISLRFSPEALRDGMDPLSFIRYLQTLGSIIQLQTLNDSLPPLAELDPERCYLGFELSFASQASKQEIDNVFEFIRADSEIRILPPHSRILDYIELIQSLPEQDLRLGEMLVQCHTLTETELTEALAIQQQMMDQSGVPPLGDIMLKKGMTSRLVLEAAIEKQHQIRDKQRIENQSIRIDADKLDVLINLIGELVIASAGSVVQANASEDVTMCESVSVLTDLVEEIRNAALQLRMVQIGSTFNRFQRVVRDVSQQMNKEIHLHITGADTEVDKTLVEKISDPLLHLVRNAIDHGIEAPHIRQQKGKPPSGELQLNAFHDSGSIVIEVIDDGAGLKTEQILAKALERGLISEDHSLSQQQINNLIFEPGFSTAETVTNLSGRGVGMDVVKRNIAALRGTVELHSEADKGTRFRIRMPLTLAIIDGFLVGVAQTTFVIPLDTVIECVELQASHKGQNYINLRGEVLPLIRLRQLYSLNAGNARRENMVVVSHGNKKAGLVVDQLLGEFQTVIKPLGDIFSHVQGVGGSTILGSGEVALILNVSGLIQQVKEADFVASRIAV